jgi:hypothetical protein
VFFEPLLAGTEPEVERRSEIPEWSAPPSSEIGAVIAVDRMVAQSAIAVVVLPMVRVFRSGCMVDVEVVSRQGDLSDDDWWRLSWSAHGLVQYRAGDLPDRLLRMGVRYSDGTKATTLELRPRRRMSSPGDEPPTGPLLSLWPSGSGMRGGGAFGLDRITLWLWPLPPAENFEFAVEWPLGGIELTIVELDGAAIAAAAERSTEFWQDSGEDSLPG